MKQHPSKESVHYVERQTYSMLDEIGLPYKRVSEYKWVNEERPFGALWCGRDEEAGHILIYLGCDAGAVAHEIGHGFHEALNHNRKSTLVFPFRYVGDKGEDDGEAVAEAVRYFVEKRLGSSWSPNNHQQTLINCNYDFETFKSAVIALAN